MGGRLWRDENSLLTNNQKYVIINYQMKEVMCMYKIIVKSRGKYGNVTPGARYCFTKRSAVNLAVTFMKNECDIDIAKFIRVHSDIFTWSTNEVDWKIWDKIRKTLDELARV
jgi:hypothetical protein